MHVLVVCVGNICRSPFAAACLQTSCRDLQVSSAGLAALIDHPADAMVQQLAAEACLDLSHHVARQVLAEHVSQADLVLVMSQSQEKELINRFPFARGRVYRLGHWAGYDIPDPYQQTIDIHRQVQTQIRDAVSNWCSRLALLKGNK